LRTLPPQAGRKTAKNNADRLQLLLVLIVEIGWWLRRDLPDAFGLARLEGWLKPNFGRT
jgi:hypothetical protein